MNCEHDPSRAARTRRLWEATTMRGPMIGTAVLLACLLYLHGSVRAQQAARDALAKYEKQRQESRTESSEKQNWKVRMECLVKLVKTGPAAVPVLVECLKNEKAPPYTRAFAAQALGLLADAGDRPALLLAIEDKDAYVAAQARIALGRLGRLGLSRSGRLRGWSGPPRPWDRGGWLGRSRGWPGRSPSWPSRRWLGCGRPAENWDRGGQPRRSRGWPGRSPSCSSRQCRG
jgi:hypothetical protein